MKEYMLKLTTTYDTLILIGDIMNINFKLDVPSVTSLLNATSSGIGKVYNDFIGDKKKLKIVGESGTPFVVEYIEGNLYITAVDEEDRKIKQSEESRALKHEKRMLDNVLTVTKEALSSLNEEISIENLDESFDFEFFNFARYAYTEEQRIVFSQVLVRELKNTENKRSISTRTLRIITEMSIDEINALINLQSFVALDMINGTIGSYPFLLSNYVNANIVFNEVPIDFSIMQLMSHGLIAPKLYGKKLSLTTNLNGKDVCLLYINQRVYTVNPKIKELDTYRLTKEGAEIIFSLNGGINYAPENFNEEINTFLLNQFQAGKRILTYDNLKIEIKKAK
ncbi:DUF2806 domain-containing protein [Mollicutes bacterium LVI A0039]|nr:DUF2806 domain-containing protein [Mollicutes bacterium LVI A0039]